jgi:hypothetical protein
LLQHLDYAHALQIIGKHRLPFFVGDKIPLREFVTYAFDILLTRNADSLKRCYREHASRISLSARSF